MKRINAAISEEIHQILVDTRKLTGRTNDELIEIAIRNLPVISSAELYKKPEQQGDLT